MKKVFIISVLCSFVSMGLFAQNEASPKSSPKGKDAITVSNEAPKEKYTFGDFFDALDDVSHASDVPRLLQRLCSRFELLLLH